MKERLILKRTEIFVKKALAGESTGHDWWHIEREERENLPPYRLHL